jgi:RNA polymerase sigma-70 factor (ECF subfamily)
MSEGELVRQARAGRTEAYAELVHRWAGRVTALCHAKVGRGDVADDLAQETLLRAYRTLASLADPEKFGPWLCAIARHICLDWLKSKQRTQVPFSALRDGPPVESVPDRAAASSTLEREEEGQQVLRAVEELPEDYREVVMLYYYQDVTYQELGQQLGVSAATINARLTRARALLRERLSPVRR